MFTGTHKELIVLISREGFVLDWRNTLEQLNHDAILQQKQWYEHYRVNAYEFLFFLGISDQWVLPSDSIRFLGVIATSFVKALAATADLAMLREEAVVELEPETIERLLSDAPYMTGSEHLNRAWMANVWSRLSDVYAAKMRAYGGSVADFFAAQNSLIHLAGRVYFHLVESKNDGHPFAFMATYSSGMAQGGKAKHLPLQHALEEYKDDQKKLLELLSTVHQASERSTFVSELVESGEIFHPLHLTASDAYTCLSEIPLYEEAGILCRIPNWWKNKSNSLKLSISLGNSAPSQLGYNSIVDFHTQLSMGGDTITQEELNRLLSEAEGLALIKGKWVEVNHKKLQEALQAYEQAQKMLSKTDMSLVEAMRFQLTASKMVNIAEEVCELQITNGKWLNSVVEKLIHPSELEDVSGGEDFHAELREYQSKGLAWLYSMKEMGLGACLADDMGLGKTVQIIGLLNSIRTRKQEKTLLVIPTSLIGNWVNEMNKFAPSLSYRVLHPSEHPSAKIEGRKMLEGCDLLITTYGMLLRYDWLKEVTWDSLILDEAQAIKNPGTKQTRAVKQIKATFKIAMTGTPIENRLSDLWSLFDFLNKGLLGSAKEFADFTKKLQENQGGYARLKQVVSPFLLRRLKTDKSVIADLPEKIESKTYATLSKKQAVLYQVFVNELTTKIESAEEGVHRNGLVLSSLLKFKQICNHPDHYLGQHGFAESESGKFARLREICETIYELRERVLVFTQFKEMTEPLKEFLEKVFDHKGLVLHGETPVNKRRDIVSAFQGDDYIPFLVLSIKAGGVGLNLTAANHVIHFDRWWNPAVEDQATDRAFRIGQKKNVIVHKFITKGTIEEKIELVMEGKKTLSNEIIPTMQETWITEMDNEQLLNLFRLSI